MPSVREVSPDEQPAKLEVVEVRPGVFLKLNQRDKEIMLRAEADAARTRGRWEEITAGRPDPEAPAEPEAEDGEPEPKLEAMTKAGLVELAEQRGLDTSGTKADLIARLTAEPDAEDGEAEGD